MVMQNDREFVDVILLYFRKDADEPQPVKIRVNLVWLVLTGKGHWLHRSLLVAHSANTTVCISNRSDK
jgi:hypothetical protein